MRSFVLLLGLVGCQAAPPPPPPVAANTSAPAPVVSTSPPPIVEEPKAPPAPTASSGPPCPEPTSALETTLPDAEAAIQKLKKSFSSCAMNGRGGSTELTWLVPAQGKVAMITDPEPEISEWCLIKKAKAVAFPKRTTKNVLVNARIRVESSGNVEISVTQAPEGKAVVCEVVTTGATAPGTLEKALALADSFSVCYQLAQKSDPSQSGRLHFELDLKADGTVGDSKSDGARRTDLVRGCALSTARLARFPEPSGAAHIGFDVRFVVE
jgi:hypothetical protein